VPIPGEQPAWPICGARCQAPKDAPESSWGTGRLPAMAPGAGLLGTRAELSQRPWGLGSLAPAVHGPGDLLSPQWLGS